MNQAIPPAGDPDHKILMIKLGAVGDLVMASAFLPLKLKQRIVRHRGVGELNLLDSSLAQISGRPLRSGHEEFFQVWNTMANVVPKEGGKVGLFYFNGNNAEGHPCIFLKIRRAFNFNRFDLRECEPALQSAFGEHYLGGGGHAGAVSFRVLPMEESRFRWKAAAIVSFLEKQIN